MDDGRISNDDENRLLELSQQAALYDFPNPERIGCPGSELLRKLAYDRNSIALTDPSLTHVVRCSPCFREFSEFRKQAEKRRQNRRLNSIAAIFAVFGILVLTELGIRYLSSANATRGEAYIAAHLDLKNRSVVRGNDDVRSPAFDSLRLPHNRVSLTITLPFASEPGSYEVQILRELGKPLLTASGQAYLENGTTLLKLQMDLTSLKKARYLIGIRRVPLEWTYHPVMVQ